MKSPKVLLLFIAITLVSVPGSAGSLKIVAKKVKRLPEIDGIVDKLWEQATPLKLAVKPIDPKLMEINTFYRKGKATGRVKVRLKAVHNGEYISFLARWPDSTKNAQHKLLKWDKIKVEYAEDETSSPEDRFAFAFGMKENFCACMVYPVETIHDIWHWKAYRTNTMGFLDDKRHLISMKKTLRASRIMTLEGQPIWLKRPRDRGRPPYILTDTYEYQGESVPKYTVQVPSGSAADVKGKGVWLDGWWTLETKRKLNTGYEDDYTFAKDKTTKMAVSVFNSTVAQFHSTSEVIELELE